MTIQQLKYTFRTSLSADLGRVVMTSGVACLEAETIARILAAVRSYDQFGEDIDPYGERDKGRFTVCGEDYYWKIYYYDRNLEYHSPDPADPSVTVRVHTPLNGDTPLELTGETTSRRAHLNHFQWKSQRRVRYQLPMAA